MSKRHARMAGKLHSWTTLAVSQLCSCLPRIECGYWVHTSGSTPLLFFPVSQSNLEEVGRMRNR